MFSVRTVFEPPRPQRNESSMGLAFAVGATVLLVASVAEEKSSPQGLLLRKRKAHRGARRGLREKTRSPRLAK